MNLDAVNVLASRADFPFAAKEIQVRPMNEGTELRFIDFRPGLPDQIGQSIVRFGLRNFRNAA